MSQPPQVALLVAGTALAAVLLFAGTPEQSTWGFGLLFAAAIGVMYAARDARLRCELQRLELKLAVERERAEDAQVTLRWLAVRHSAAVRPIVVVETTPPVATYEKLQQRVPFT